MADYIIQDSTLTAIADAVRGKTGDVNVMTPMEMVSAIEGISTGGGGSSGGEEWIGDGNTHLWINLGKGRTNPMLGLGVNGSVTVDWGDGSKPDVLTGTDTSTVVWTHNHEYNEDGEYVITLKADGDIVIRGDGSSSCILCGDTSGGNYINHGYRSSLKKIEIGHGVVEIGDYGFANCYALASIFIPDGVTSIGTYAFSQCNSLTEITVPASVTSIGELAFYYCSSIENIVVPVTGKSMCGMGSRALRELTILNGVESIAENAFFQCVNLTSIDIPASVMSIEAMSFRGCQSLKAVYFTSHSTVPTLVDSSAFGAIPDDCEFFVPAALVDEWKAATNWSTYASQIVGV